MKKMIILAVLMVAGLFVNSELEAQVAGTCIFSKPVKYEYWHQGANGHFTLNCISNGRSECSPYSY